VILMVSLTKTLESISLSDKNPKRPEANKIPANLASFLGSNRFIRPLLLCLSLWTAQQQRSLLMALSCYAHLQSCNAAILNKQATESEVDWLLVTDLAAHFLESLMLDIKNSRLI
jgi:hypothetical protein